jgi:hypothetical protein
MNNLLGWRDGVGGSSEEIRGVESVGDSVASKL